MAEMTKSEMLKIVEDNISKLKDKTFRIYFYVLDTKGNPSTSLEYIYQTALVLSKKGYNVTMLHQEKDFVGVGEWLGKEYAELPHANIEKDNVETSPSDFLFIPEIFANVMMQTKKLPCKRVMLTQNYKHITEFMPVSMSLETIGITDAIATTDRQAEMTKKYFPTVRTHVVHPSIKKVFRNNDAPRKLIINVVSKEQQDVNQIVKPFYWNNPLYKWVSFRDLRGLTKEAFAEGLREAAATIWIDNDTDFGNSLLEALRCGTIVLAKVPNEPVEWMLDDDGSLTNSILWFDNNNDVPDMIASLVRTWTLDQIPEDVYTEQAKFENLYSEEDQEVEIEEVYIKGLFERRLKEFEEARVGVENNEFKTKEEE